MRWAIIDSQRKVISIVDSDVRPDEGVKAFPESKCDIGRIWNGVTFDGPSWSAYEFMLRFTPQERAAVRAIGMTDPVVADFLFLATAAGQISSDDPSTIAGMDYLVQSGVISVERKQEILS